MIERIPLKDSIYDKIGNKMLYKYFILYAQCISYKLGVP